MRRLVRRLGTHCPAGFRKVPGDNFQGSSGSKDDVTSASRSRLVHLGVFDRLKTKLVIGVHSKPTSSSASRRECLVIARYCLLEPPLKEQEPISSQHFNCTTHVTRCVKHLGNVYIIMLLDGSRPPYEQDLDATPPRMLPALRSLSQLVTARSPQNKDPAGFPV